LTFPPPSILAGIDKAASRDRSEGVEAEEWTLPSQKELEEEAAEGINLESKAIFVSV
jgi:hypothetical protein